MTADLPEQGDAARVAARDGLDAFRAAARAFLGDHAGVAPHDYGAIVPLEALERAVEWQRTLYRTGWAGLHWPVEHGGQGLGHEHAAIWLEECALADVAPFLNMVGIVLAGTVIQRFGTPEQQRRHLRPTLAAQQVWCQLFSEPGAGSDLASLSTRAERDGDEWVVNGQKVWCSGGRASHWGILMARTDPSAARHRGISFFLCDMGLRGIEVRPLRQMTGAAEFDEVFFTDARLPADALIGPLHDGWSVGMATLTSERGHIGAAVIGLQRRLAQLAALGSGRELDPTERQRLAGLVARGRAFGALGRRQGIAAGVGSSLMKLGITELMFDAAGLRADLDGAAAMLMGRSAEGLLSAPGARIAGGTSQVQRTIIGERLLGLPKEPAG